MHRPTFITRDDYVPRFTDAVYWRPYVEAVCRRHELGACRTITTGLAGSHPVFLVDDRLVVKFFADLFGGPRSFAAERAIYGLTQITPALDAPRLLAAGELFDTGDAWRWPYLVSMLIPGAALVTVAEQLPAGAHEAIAAYAGRQLRALHNAPLAAAGLDADWAPFAGWIDGQRAGCAQRYHRVLPDHLLKQVEAFLSPTAELIDQAQPPRLLHCDLNADHLLVEHVHGEWLPRGIIDFGDAKIGDPLYELGALHVGMFGGDTRLLRAFLRAYGPDEAMQRDFARRAMSYALLHEFDIVGDALQQRPELRAAPTLAEMANMLWEG
jgi:hygromycin-B 7''-O-kinase